MAQPTTEITSEKPQGFYSSKRKAGMREVRFWVDEEYKDDLNLMLRSLISKVHPRDVLLGIMELRLILEQQKAETQG